LSQLLHQTSKFSNWQIHHFVFIVSQNVLLYQCVSEFIIFFRNNFLFLPLVFVIFCFHITNDKNKYVYYYIMFCYAQHFLWSGLMYNSTNGSVYENFSSWFLLLWIFHSGLHLPARAKEVKCVGERSSILSLAMLSLAMLSHFYFWNPNPQLLKIHFLRSSFFRVSDGDGSHRRRHGIVIFSTQSRKLSEIIA
jgi:hypothetical protein